VPADTLTVPLIVFESLVKSAVKAKVTEGRTEKTTLALPNRSKPAVQGMDLTGQHGIAGEDAAGSKLQSERAGISMRT